MNLSLNGMHEEADKAAHHSHSSLTQAWWQERGGPFWKVQPDLAAPPYPEWTTADMGLYPVGSRSVGTLQGDMSAAGIQGTVKALGLLQPVTCFRSLIETRHYRDKKLEILSSSALQYEVNLTLKV